VRAACVAPERARATDACLELFGELRYPVLEAFLGAAKSVRIEKSEEFVELN